MHKYFQQRLKFLQIFYNDLITRKNNVVQYSNGVYERYEYPVLTAGHAPLQWKYDFNESANPYLMERFGINAVFNSGAIKFNDKYILVPRVEGADRKSFFAIAESDNGIDNFIFWEYPVTIPSIKGEVNIYDIRLVQHEDGWIYGLFCTERRDASAQDGDQSSAIAQCGIVRTKDLLIWERLPDLKTPSPQQKNVVLHPEFYKGKYAFYTRPRNSFIEAGNCAKGISIELPDTVGFFCCL